MAVKHIYLSGFMGVGKTCVGRELGHLLQRPFYDLDAVIETLQGLSVAEIFRRDGEKAFRKLETSALQSLARKKQPAVISLGGGTPLKPENRAVLKRGYWFFLHRPLKVIAPRLNDAGKRPLLATHDWRDLYQQREPIYRLATYTIYCENFSFDTICATIAHALKSL